MTDGRERYATEGPAKSGDIVYGWSHRYDCLVFIEQLTAQSMDDDLTAFCAAGTYRAAAAVPMRELSNPLARELGDDPDEEERDWDAPLDLQQIFAVQEEEWPPPLVFFTQDALPEDVSEEFGEYVEPMMGAEHLRILAEEEDDVVRALQDLGHRVRRDDALVRRLGLDT